MLTRLKNHKINKAYDFIKLPDDWVRKQMSIVGLRLKKELEGRIRHYLLRKIDLLKKQSPLLEVLRET